jgi:phosphatidylserine/phosphatidylglycerophosphate/cardiolipin synthase-like enzyme
MTDDRITIELLTACDTPDTQADQVTKVAGLFRDFVRQARQSLHIAIYDFRLDGDAAKTVIDALNERAEAGVTVRVAYFQPKKAGKTAAAFRAFGGDPAPEPDPDFLGRLHDRVQKKAIHSVDIDDLPHDVEIMPIEGGGHLMHSKYMVRDGLYPAAAVWTGSTNFTTDAWGRQENNIVIIQSQDVAGYYETDFAELWQAERIAGTGKNDIGDALVDHVEVDVAFAPGDGPTIDHDVAGYISAAQSRITIAAMVISSGSVLGALIDAIDRGVEIAGIYDGPEMADVLHDFERGGHQGSPGAAKAAQWQAVARHLVAKRSHPYTEAGPHDFMHNKVMVVDGDLVVTGSFNFSQNATHNAENLVVLHDPEIAEEYERYIEKLMHKYS